MHCLLFLLLFVAITPCLFASDKADTTERSGDTALVRPDTTTNKYGVLTGIVTDPAGNPLVGATVRVEGTTRGGYTKLDGAFCILKIKPGTYTIRVSSLGFHDGTTTATITAEAPAEVTFSLAAQDIPSLEFIGCRLTRFADPENIGTIRRISSEELQSTPP